MQRGGMLLALSSSKVFSCYLKSEICNGKPRLWTMDYGLWSSPGTYSGASGS